ncbi:MAG: hypothetical protein IJQ60_13010 [Prevotella sp.]|nr:hypothetical protein [Prevotella sp.]
MKKSLIYGLSAGIMVLLGSCASKDVYNAEQVEISQREAYATNFVKKYGPIATNQTWDFTGNKVRLGTRSGEDITIETVAGLDFGVTESLDENNKVVATFTKNVDLYNDVPLKLPDGKRHTGESAILIAPSNDFYIYPISCQGSWKHDFCVRVGDAEPVKIYNKFWSDFSKPYVNGMATNSSVKDGVINVTKRAEMPGVHISAPTGTPVEVYLDNIQGGSQPMASTVTGSAIVIDTEVRPEGVPINDQSVVKYIGIEDQYDKDYDYNDMVMVVIGNPDTPPTEKIIDEKYQVPTNISKRYMIEDLGATDDFDFNDIVVDVVQNTTVTHHRTYKVDAEGNKSELISDIITNTSSSQKATIRHKGGILPFILKVGNTTFNEEQGELDVDVEITKNVSGWNPEKNNVSIKVQEKDGKYYDIAFPKAGEAPMIIAVDIDQNWMPERQSVPASWFYLPE